MRCFASSQEYVSTAVREVLLYVPTRQKKSLATFEMLYSTPPQKKKNWLNPTKVVMIY